jgi:hypothetical protein
MALFTAIVPAQQAGSNRSRSGRRKKGKGRKSRS